MTVTGILSRQRHFREHGGYRDPFDGSRQGGSGFHETKAFAARPPPRPAWSHGHASACVTRSGYLWLRRNRPRP